MNDVCMCAHAQCPSFCHIEYDNDDDDDDDRAVAINGVVQSLCKFNELNALCTFVICLKLISLCICVSRLCFKCLGKHMAP